MQSPSLYHLLARLLDLVYNSSPATSTFYADILFQLFTPEVIKTIEVPTTDLRSQHELKSDHLSGNENGKRRRDPSRTGEHVDTAEQHTSSPSNNGLDPHIAIHARALAFFVSREYYSAIHLVRDLACGSSSKKDLWALGEYGDLGNEGKESVCVVCSNILAKCCAELGRFEEGLEVLELAGRHIDGGEGKHGT